MSKERRCKSWADSIYSAILIQTRRKLLFIVNSFENGAVPNILLDIAPTLSSAGWLLQFLSIEALPETHESVKRCRLLGLPLESLELGPRASLSAILALRKKIHEAEPDLIHTHLGRADIFAPWAKGGVPQITTFHSVRQNYNRLTLAGYRVTDNLVAHRTGVSQAAIDSFYARGPLTSAHSVIYNPVNPERIKPRRSRKQVFQALGWPDQTDDPLLVCVGRLMPVKDQKTLIAALPLLLEDFPRLRCVIAGDGPLKPDLAARIHALGLDDHVKLAGPWDGVADLYAAAAALVFPSLWEGLGLVPLEAMACGCPVAASDIPAVREFLVDRENGLLFQPSSPESLARAVKELLENPALTRERAERGRKKVLECFAPDRIAGQYLALYDEVLAR